jgi:ankyrin repeat protein
MGNWEHEVRRDAFRLIVIFAFAAGWATPLFAEDAATCATLASEFEARRAELEPPQISAALFKAADFGCETFANRLLESGASVAARDRMGGAALAHAARGGHDGVARLLLAHGAVVDLRDVQGSTPLYAAVEGNRYRAAAVLLASGADVNLPGRAGVTPLAAAAYNGNLKIADLLLAHGADASLRDLGGKAPILYAAARGFGSVVTRLLATGVGINDAYGNKLTLLMWAAGHANDVPVDDGVALVAMLLDKGALIDARDNRGRTALMTAASLGHDEIVALLLKRGADARLKDLAGKTAADLATSETTRITLAARSTP